MQKIKLSGPDGPYGPGLDEIVHDIFNETDDDDARGWASDPSSISGADNEEIIRRMNALLDDPTGDDDERAIINIFRALPCDRGREIVDKMGINRILDDMHGAEWDELMTIFVSCGIIGFDQMDDDASRAFVNKYSCAELSLLSVQSIAQLVRNMFAGVCGDDDEDAILKLLRCLSGATILALVQLPGVRLEDFDYNFDGDQWDKLEALFRPFGLNLDT